jgi:GTP cyclohydrolase I
MAPIHGRAHIGYLPRERVVGISKIARVVDAFSKRLQIQEKMTAEIANTLQAELQPHGVAVVVEGAHGCMTSRGVHQSQATMVTSRMLGLFRSSPQMRREFLSAIGLARASESGNLFP